MSGKGWHFTDEPVNEFSRELYAILAWVEAYTDACEAFAANLKALVQQQDEQRNHQR